MDDQKKFVGHYKLIKSDNYEAYLKAIDPEVKSSFTLRSGPIQYLNIEIVDDQWTLTTVFMDSVHQSKFKLGEQFEEITTDGRRMQTVFSFEEGKLVQRQKSTKQTGHNSEIIRALVGESELVVDLIVHDPKGTVVAKRYYQRE